MLKDRHVQMTLRLHEKPVALQRALICSFFWGDSSDSKHVTDCRMVNKVTFCLKNETLL
jgi:hypothetical protein